jgi:hypothetical protein
VVSGFEVVEEPAPVIVQIPEEIIHEANDTDTTQDQP